MVMVVELRHCAWQHISEKPDTHGICGASCAHFIAKFALASVTALNCLQVLNERGDKHKLEKKKKKGKEKSKKEKKSRSKHRK